MSNYRRPESFRYLIASLATAILVAPLVAAPLPAGLPAGAVAYYAFGDADGAFIPNSVDSSEALPGLAIRGSDVTVSEQDATWNAGIGNFTFTFPFDPDNGTFAETLTSFPNTAPPGGTLAVRLRLADSVSSLGQASSMGLITFRPAPDINIHRVPPRSLELHRDGPTDPPYFLVREGNNSIGYNNEFNDEVRSGPLSNLTAERTVVVVWTLETLQIYVDGVLSGTSSRVTADHPTPSYRLMVAVQPSLIHSADRQFYAGALRTLVVYRRPMTSGEVASLTAALNGSAGPQVPGAPQNLRIIS
jgi:hypothetical protein